MLVDKRGNKGIIFIVYNSKVLQWQQWRVRKVLTHDNMTSSWKNLEIYFHFPSLYECIFMFYHLILLSSILICWSNFCIQPSICLTTTSHTLLNHDNFTKNLILPALKLWSLQARAFFLRTTCLQSKHSIKDFRTGSGNKSRRNKKI